VAAEIHFSGGSQKCYGRICPLGHAAAAAEQIRGGVTTFADMYYLRMPLPKRPKPRECAPILGETILDFPASDNKPTPPCWNTPRKFLKRWQGDALIPPRSRRIRLYLFAKDTSGFGARLARKIQRRRSSSRRRNKKKNWTTSRAKNGTTPVQYLDKLGILASGLGGGATAFLVDGTTAKSWRSGRVGCVPQSFQQYDAGERRCFQ